LAIVVSSVFIIAPSMIETVIAHRRPLVMVR
jgi:hypothetical protein